MLIAVDDAVDAPVLTVFDAQRAAQDAQIQIAGRFGAGDLRVERAPFRARLASLNAETLLYAHSPLVGCAGIDGQVAGMHLLVADALRAVVHHLEMIRRGQAGITVTAGDDEAPFGKFVVALQLRVLDWPVDERCARHGTIRGTCTQLPRTNTRSRAGPVHGGAAERLAGP